MNSIHLLALLVGLVLASTLIALMLKPITVTLDQQQVVKNQQQLNRFEATIKNFKAGSPSDSESWVRELNQEAPGKAYLYTGKDIEPGVSISAQGPLLQACVGRSGTVTCQNFRVRVGATGKPVSASNERLARAKASK